MFFLVIIIFIYLQSTSFKGKIGESIVNYTINKKLDKNEYHLIKDITIPVLGSTTQIDQVIVSRYGIFVIEIINMKDWINGSERQKVWTQTFPRGKFKFQNPLHQNYKHIKALAHTPDLADDKFYSVIVFTGDSTFKTIMPKNVLDRSYTNYIKSKDTVIFSSAEVYECIEKIELLQLEKSRTTNKKHIQHLKEKYQ